MKWSAGEIALVPWIVCTVTSTNPAACAGETALIVVPEETTNDVALVAPNLTAVTPVKPVPEMVTVVPPAARPLCRLTADTVGGPSGTV